MSDAFIGVSHNVKQIKEIIARVAETGINVIIQGETGVGKEVVARRLYLESPRNRKPFVKVNCAAFPEGLLESELFGYEKGAFTGAATKKRGKFELADKGVLFLDEIGEMSLNLQAKLLHVLQSGEFSPLGSEKDVKTDIWILAATNQDLDRAAKKQTFRKDLYYRLNIVKLLISPLRERPEDIPLLIDHYITQYNQAYKQYEDLKRPPGSVMKRLLSYRWPGNVRELQNFLKRTLVLGDWEKMLGELGDPARFRAEAGAGNPQSRVSSIIADYYGVDPQNPGGVPSVSLNHLRKRASEEVEKEIITHILHRTGGNRSRAARVLKVSYKTLLTKISDLHIE